jgi:hypothetical protein
MAAQAHTDNAPGLDPAKVVVAYNPPLQEAYEKYCAWRNSEFL